MGRLEREIKGGKEKKGIDTALTVHVQQGLKQRTIMHNLRKVAQAIMPLKTLTVKVISANRQG